MTADKTSVLTEALKECADILEAQVNDRYPDYLRNGYLRFERMYERDMQPVLKARAALKEAGY